MHVDLILISFLFLRLGFPGVAEARDYNEEMIKIRKAIGTSMEKYSS